MIRNTYLLFAFSISLISCDRLCHRKDFGADSFVCSCTSEYCDTISPAGPTSKGNYTMYTTSRNEYRFEKSEGCTTDLRNGDITIEMNETLTYQKIIGFGGAATDSTGINIMKLSKGTRQKIFESYFGNDGIGYNIIRVPIGGSDFSTRGYTYNDLPENDINLSNFSLAPEDIVYKIPVIKDCIKQSTSDVYLIGSCWSPPRWMKTNHNLTGQGKLKKVYYQAYANYHIRFLEEYRERELEFWSLTTGNEPRDGNEAIDFINTLGWSPYDQADWIQQHFGPTVRKSPRFCNTTILGLDDNRDLLPTWIDVMKSHNSGSLHYLDGIAVHWYFDFKPANSLSLTHQRYPDKFIINTEGSAAAFPWELPKVLLGSWTRAESYALDILEDLSHHVTGWVDWNMVLDKQGGPNWVNNHVDSPVISIPETDEFLKQPMFYIIGHFSKFIPRGSKHIKSVIIGASLDVIYHVAFLKPDNSIVLVVYNKAEYLQSIKIKNQIRYMSFTVDIPAKAIQTILI